jgi:hypothetical protein
LSNLRKKIFIDITLIYFVVHIFTGKERKTPSLWYKMLWKLSKLKILCRITVATAAVQVMLVQTCSVKEKKEEEKILSDKYSFILC